MAERVGFEPTCRLRDKTLSRRPRYDHFGTSPFIGARSVPLAVGAVDWSPPHDSPLPSLARLAYSHRLLEAGSYRSRRSSKKP